MHMGYRLVEVKRVFAALLINCWSFVAILLVDIYPLSCLAAKDNLLTYTPALAQSLRFISSHQSEYSSREDSVRYYSVEKLKTFVGKG